MSNHLSGTAPFTGSLVATGKINFLVLALASALVSLWLILLDPVMTSEAVLRLYEAQAFMSGGDSAGFQLQSFGPALLASLHQLSGLSLLTSANLLNGLLYIILCLAFVATVQTLGGTRRIQLFAVLLVLVHPLLCEFRSGLSLAPGYWSFILLALRQLLVYCERPDWLTRFTWFSCIGIATLFQVEALILANLAPLVLLIALPRRQRRAVSFKLLVPMWALTTVLAFSGALGAIALAQGSSIPATPQDWGMLANPGKQLPTAVAEALTSLDPGWSVAGGLLGLLTASLGRAFTGVCLLLLLLGWWRGSLAGFKTPARSLINAHVSIVLLYLAVYALGGHSVTQMDTVPGVLMLLLYLPFVLDDLWRRGPALFKLLGLAALLILASEGLHNRKFEQQYIADASNWLHANAPKQASVLSNNAYITYFAGRSPTGPLQQPKNLRKFLAEDAWRQHHFLALQLSDAQFRQWYQLASHPQLKVRQVFTGRGRDMVLVLENTSAPPR